MSPERQRQPQSSGVDAFDAAEPLPEIDAYGMSDQGRVRPENEDQYAIVDLVDGLVWRDSSVSRQPAGFSGSAGKLLVVADGIGGAAGGAEASRIAVETAVAALVGRPLASLAAATEERLEREIRSAVRDAQEQIARTAQERPQLAGMGTTLTLALVLWPRAWIAHVGDSRCYLWRQGRLRQVTTDHTVAQRFLDEGMPAGDVELSRWGDVLWNALGGDEMPLRIEEHRLDLRRGDVLLLCTDGITRDLDERALAGVLKDQRSARGGCRELIRLASDAGGVDNLTAVVARFGDAGAEARSLEEGDTLPLA